MRLFTKILTVICTKFQELAEAFSDDEPYAHWMDYGKWQETRLPQYRIRAERRAERHGKKRAA